jgi:ABC-2 type transport system ATP-binding protein
MRDLIRGFAAEHGLTVFLSSHLLGEVEQIASHVGIIGRGRQLFEGPLCDLQRRQRARVVVEVDRASIARSLLREAGWTVEHLDESADQPSLTVDLQERVDIARAANLIVGAGLNLYQLRTVRPVLEDLFLDLTSGANLASQDDEVRQRLSGR